MIEPRFGYSTRSVKPVLHVYDRTVVHRDDKEFTVWRCRNGAWTPRFVGEPNGLPPCRGCHFDKPLPVEAVYFAEKDGLIKIGCSHHPAQRVEGLHARQLLTIPGDGRTEAALHLAFAHLRVQGEWFTPGADLLRFIEQASWSETGAR